MFCLLTWIPSSLSSPALFLADSDSGVSSVPSLALSFLSSLANGRLWQFTDWGWGCSKVRIRISHLPPHWGTSSASHSANLLTPYPPQPKTHIHIPKPWFSSLPRGLVWPLGIWHPCQSITGFDHLKIWKILRLLNLEINTLLI